MDMDVEVLCGVAYGERTLPRENSRDGYRDRPWKRTPIGERCGGKA
jgi:hypothetical protein